MARISIRRRPRAVRPSLTAAAQRVSDPQKSFRKASMGADDDWQAQAWKYLELVGELAYYASWRSSSASRVRFIASALGEDGEPTGALMDDTAEARRVREIVRSIAGGAGGQAQLLKRHVYLLTVPGECWAAMIVRDPSRETRSDGSAAPLTPSVLMNRDAPTEQWFCFHRDEIASKGNEVVLSLPDGTKHTFNPEVDVMFRIWEPHPKNAALPVSPVWANRTVLNEIVKATATIDTAAKSRLVGNGMMFIPQEMSLPSQVAPTSIPIGSDPSPVDGPVQTWEPSTSQELQDLLYEVASTAIKEPDSLAALIPIIASGPGEWIKNIQWLRPSSDIPETALKTRSEAIRRLAMGLDMAPERLLGLGANSNHWSAWAIDESDVRLHIAPPVETVCNAYTQEVLRPKLIQEGIDPDRYVIWHDDTRLTQDPDKKDEAQQAHDRGALTSTALLAYLGFDESDGYDLTSQEGWLQLAMDKSAKDPALIPLFAPLLGKLVDGISAPEQPALPSTPPPPAVPPAPRQEPDTETSSTDDGLNAAAYGLTRICVNRALEMANKRQRTRANHASFQNVPITEAHLNLPPVPADEVESLIRGWDTCVDDTTCEAFGFDPVLFREMVTDTARDALTAAAAWRFQPQGMQEALRR